MSYFRADDADDLEQSNDFDDDGRTPLDKTIDRIGMGACLITSTDHRAVTNAGLSTRLGAYRQLSMDSSFALRIW